MHRLGWCAVSGAPWRPEWTQALAGMRVIIMDRPDAQGLADALQGVAQEVRVLKGIRDIRSMVALRGFDEVSDLLAQKMVETPPWAPGGEWGEPVPFDTVQLPDFPLEALPQPLAAMAESLSEFTQTPPSMGGTLILGALAAAVQDKYEYSGKWREPLSLYVSPVSPPGTRKGAVFRPITAPLIRHEAERRRMERDEVNQSRERIKALKKALEATENKFAAGKIGMAEVQDADREYQEAKAAEKHEYRLLATDTTPEKLVEMMSQQGGSLTVYSSEGGLFDQITGRRYDNSGGLDIYLQAHDAEPIRVDRIGRGSNNVERPHLSILLTVQPDVIRGLMGNTTAVGRGLVARFLFVKDVNMVGKRKIDPPPIPDEVSKQYEYLMYRLLSAPYQGDIVPSPEADRIRAQYQAHIEPKLAGQWEHMAGFGGKLTGTMLRIAALLHVAQVDGDPTKVPILPETMEAAVKLAEFYGAHAEAVYTDMGADSDQADAKYLWRRIKGTGQAIISKRDLFNQCKGKFKHVDQMDPALHTLIDMGYIRVEDVSTGGRPTQKIMVNPLEQK